MSDNWLQFVPEAFGRTPTAEAAERAVAMMEAIAKPRDHVEARFPDEPEFVFPGANPDEVFCPACGADCEPWWSDSVTAAAKDGFGDLAVTTPCCGTKTTLHALRYDWPAGFGKFVLEVMNPTAEITPEHEQLLAECLGMPLRKVWMHI